jgi:hypothetical protein
MQKKRPDVKGKAEKSISLRLWTSRDGVLWALLDKKNAFENKKRIQKR